MTTLISLWPRYLSKPHYQWVTVSRSTSTGRVILQRKGGAGGASVGVGSTLSYAHPNGFAIETGCPIAKLLGHNTLHGDPQFYQCAVYHTAFFVDMGRVLDVHHCVNAGGPAVEASVQHPVLGNDLCRPLHAVYNPLGYP